MSRGPHFPFLQKRVVRPTLPGAVTGSGCTLLCAGHATAPGVAALPGCGLRTGQREVRAQARRRKIDSRASRVAMRESLPTIQHVQHQLLRDQQPHVAVATPRVLGPWCRQDPRPPPPRALGSRGPCLASVGRGVPAGTVRSPGRRGPWEELTEVNVHWHPDRLGAGRTHRGPRKHEVVHLDAHGDKSLPRQPCHFPPDDFKERVSVRRLVVSSSLTLANLLF